MKSKVYSIIESSFKQTFIDVSKLQHNKSFNYESVENALLQSNMPMLLLDIVPPDFGIYIREELMFKKNNVLSLL
jgi:hypothetical protein